MNMIYLMIGAAIIIFLLGTVLPTVEKKVTYYENCYAYVAETHDRTCLVGYK